MGMYLRLHGSKQCATASEFASGRASCDGVLGEICQSPDRRHDALEACYPDVLRTWVPQGLFEIAARTYRSRASVAASLDEDQDDGVHASEAVWETATDDEDLDWAAASNGAQLRQGGQNAGWPAFMASLEPARGAKAGF